jgi:hypothetical protein
LDDLTDVDTTGLVDGDVLVWDAGSSTWIAAAATSNSLDGLSDVDTTGVSDGDVLAYDSGSLSWVPVAPGGVGSSVQGKIQELRLTLTSATPVTTSNVSSATTIYLTPYRGNGIALYNGTNWGILNTAEVSIALGTLTSGKNYDVFAYNNTGTVTLEVLAWTNDTTRATALTTQDGVLVKSGANTRRYLGTFRTISTTQTCDTESKRFLWNYYNRVQRKLKAVDATATWNYSTASFRQANNNTANQVEVVIGVAEESISLRAFSVVTNSTSTVRYPSCGIGVNSATVNSADVGAGNTSCTNSLVAGPISFLNHVTLGYTYYAWLEYGGGADTQTFFGTSGTTLTGIAGVVVG